MRCTIPLAPSLWGSVPPCNTWFLGSFHGSWIFIQNGISIGAAIFAQLTIECPIILQWAAVSSKIGGSPWGSGPPSNTWYWWPTRVIIPNGISSGSAVFVWVPNAMLYNALSIGKKTPKLPLPLGFRHPARGGPSHDDRQYAQKTG